MAKLATESKKEAAPARKNVSSKLNSSETQREIEKLAYQFFVERGCEHGHDAEDWLRAETVVKSRTQS